MWVTIYDNTLKSVASKINKGVTDFFILKLETLCDSFVVSWGTRFAQCLYYGEFISVYPKCRDYHNK